MSKNLLDVMCCPISGCDFEHVKLSKQYAYLYGRASNTYVPIINEIVFVKERSIFISEADCLQSIQELSTKCGVNNNEYSEFIKQKSRRPYNDAYAAFQPFNEASKAFYPFINGIKQSLQPGDIILDIWNRTGWSTFFLASLFPEQHIVSIWDANKDVLGYKGYNYWFTQQDIPANISVVFSNLNEVLPFKKESIKFIYAMDTLHWFPLETYLPELLRITSSKSTILFPHVHMANNDPTPFFERGGRQLHGKQYQAIFDKMLVNYNRKGYVLSEPFLFKLEDEVPILSMPDTSDYNGCIAILPDDHEIVLKPFDLSEEQLIQGRLIINPFLIINYSQATIELDRSHFEGSVGHIIDRHPVYESMLTKNDGYLLSDKMTQILYYGSCNLTLAEISQHTQIKYEEVVQLAQQLQKRNIVEILPISETGFRLQHFHSSQDYLTSKHQQTLEQLWKDAVHKFSNQTLLNAQFDESLLEYEEVDEIVQLVVKRFQKDKLVKGDKIAVYAPISAESLFLFWACMLNGQVFIPISHLMPKDQLNTILTAYDVKLLFTDTPIKTDVTITQLLLDSFEYESDLPFFSDWLDPETLDNDIEKCPIATTDQAVILFTSGSTGQPKGVVHSQGSLFRSGRLITENFHWLTNDKYLATADLDSMSGLRNCVIAPLHVGASITIPNTRQRQHAVAISSLIQQEQITILSTTPTLLRQWLLLGRRIRSELNSVKYIMCTGSNLSVQLIDDFEASIKIPILNYYGLTETCGICVAVSRNDENFNKQSIGKSKGSVIQIVDDNDQILPYGIEGNIRVLTQNRLQSYYENELAYNKLVRNNWLYTGDTAIMDEHGWITLKGRSRDIIKNTRGDLIYPIEIEEYILQQDSIKDAHVCAKIENDLEYIVAFVVPNSANALEVISTDLTNSITEKLGKGKTPNTIKIIDELPYNTNGKVNRSKLISEYL